MSGIIRKLLVVDDTYANRSLLKVVFREYYDVLEAENGIEAIHMLQTNSDIAVVILDLIMPALDGFGVLRKMEAEGMLNSIPVIVVTADTDIENQVKVLDLGASDVVIKPFNSKLILHRVNNLLSRRETDMIAEQNRMYEAQIRQKEEMLRQSMIDEKTGIYNKSTFCTITAQLFKDNPDKQYVIVRWDIDRFKIFNDIYGTKQGDKLLRNIGKMYQNKNSKKEVFGYLGMDHFVSCMEIGEFDIDAYMSETESCLRAMHSEFEFVARYGVYLVDDTKLDVSIMCDRALLALQTTKEKSAIRLAYYDASMRVSLVEEQEIVSEVTSAIEAGQFTVYIQPQMDFSTGQVNGAEALVRWIHPVKGIIPPMKFIPVLERNGLVSILDYFVWEQVCSLLEKWIAMGIDPVPVSVNISRIDVYNPNLVGYITDLTKKHNLEPKYLRLEITESAYMENPAQLIETVSELQKAGFLVEMDDFGSGYSSLNTLKDVPVDVLKLDMRFLSACSRNERGGNILCSVVRMARWLELPVVAEGVETIEQAEYLKSIGCIYMQGYLFSKPLPIDEYEMFLAKSRTSLEMSQKMEVTGKEFVDFWDSSQNASLFFDSFIGSAAVCEVRNGEVEAFRMNDHFFELLGISQAEFARRQNLFQTLLPEEQYRIFFQTLCETDLRENVSECTLDLSNENDGEEKWLRIRCRLLAESNGSRLFFLACDDVTELGRAQRENETLRTKLNELIMKSV